jgi:hypothetical protein
VAEAVGGAAARLLALGGARGEDWTGVLLARDAVLLYGGDPDLVGLAAARLVAAGAHARPLGESPGGAVCALAAAGLALPGTLRGLRGQLAVPA